MKKRIYNLMLILLIIGIHFTARSANIGKASFISGNGPVDGIYKVGNFKITISDFADTKFDFKYETINNNQFQVVASGVAVKATLSFKDQDKIRYTYRDSNNVIYYFTVLTKEGKIEIFTSQSFPDPNGAINSSTLVKQ
jgi:hypothetical protein